MSLTATRRNRRGASRMRPRSRRARPPTLRDAPAWLGDFTGAGLAGEFDGRRFIDAGNVGDFGYYDKFSAGAWIFPRGGHGGTLVSRMLDADQGEGWSLRIDHGRAQVLLVKRWLDDSLRVESSAQLEPDRWHHVYFTYDGSRVAAGIKIYIDGKPAETVVQLDELN